MSNSNEYLTVAGIVQYDPANRDVNGKAVRDVVVKSIGQNKKVGITIWPDYAHIPINKGDFICADGAYSSRTGQDKEGNQVTYYNLSANVLFVAPSAAKAGTAPVAAAAPAAAPADDNLPF